MMKRRFVGLVLATALFCVSLTGCGGGSNKSGNSNHSAPTREQLVGSWSYASIGNSITNQVSCPGGIQGISTAYDAYCSASDFVRLNADGTFSSQTTSSNGSTAINRTGTWTLQGNLLTRTSGSANNVTIESITTSISEDGRTLFFNGAVSPTSTYLTKN